MAALTESGADEVIIENGGNIFMKLTASDLRRVAGHIPDLLIKRLQMTVHLQIHLLIQLTVNLHIVRVRHKSVTLPGHCRHRCREITVILHSYSRVNCRPESRGLIGVRPEGLKIEYISRDLHRLPALRTSPETITLFVGIFVRLTVRLSPSLSE